MVFPVVMYGSKSWIIKKVKVKVKSLSCVRLFATPWTVAYQAPPSMGFSRNTGVGCHFKLSAKELVVLNCAVGKTLENPLDCKEIQLVNRKGNQS